jgi:hypothetical protein
MILPIAFASGTTVFSIMTIYTGRDIYKNNYECDGRPRVHKYTGIPIIVVAICIAVLTWIWVLVSFKYCTPTPLYLQPFMKRVQSETAKI